MTAPMLRPSSIIKSLRRSSLWKLAFFLPIPLVIASVNYYVDPGQLFRGEDYVQRIVDLLSSGKNVWNVIYNHNERLKQRLMVAKLPTRPDIVVLGSSQTKAVGSRTFPDKYVYNAGVSAGTLEDFIGIYELFYERQLVPKEVILEVNPWLLNKNDKNVHPHFVALAREYSTALQRMGRSKDEGISLVRRLEFHPVVQLFSLGYFRQSLGGVSGVIDLSQRMIGRASTRRQIVPADLTLRTTDVPIKDTFVLVSDGTWWVHGEDLITTLADAIEYADKPRGWVNFAELDRERDELFERFIGQMQKDGAKVSLFMPPWPHETYELIKNNPRYAILTSLEQYIADVAKRYSLDVYGSYDGGELGFTLDDFYNPDHLRRPGQARIIREYKRSPTIAREQAAPP
jgi:hypothetical protein